MLFMSIALFSAPLHITKLRAPSYNCQQSDKHNFNWWQTLLAVASLQSNINTKQGFKEALSLIHLHQWALCKSFMSSNPSAGLQCTFRSHKASPLGTRQLLFGNICPKT